jgi:hypothetical protein
MSSIEMCPFFIAFSINFITHAEEALPEAPDIMPKNVLIATYASCCVAPLKIFSKILLPATPPNYPAPTPILPATLPKNPAFSSPSCHVFFDILLLIA